eukprot:scaffold39503_cov191-Amphora_coffeaeformis.AAC.3
MSHPARERETSNVSVFIRVFLHGGKNEASNTISSLSSYLANHPSFDGAISQFFASFIFRKPGTDKVHDGPDQQQDQHTRQNTNEADENPHDHHVGSGTRCHVCGGLMVSTRSIIVVLWGRSFWLDGITPLLVVF